MVAPPAHPPQPCGARRPTSVITPVEETTLPGDLVEVTGQLVKGWNGHPQEPAPSGPALGKGGRSSSVERRSRHRQAPTISRMSFAVSDGVLPTRTPAASRASCLAWAVPAEPETMAPAWPIVLPSGAVKPAT
jgi:hypothetical protein